ncbi:nuclear transport factor 2 family protein [Winogradskyella sp. DF17]|uniref:Nuclear transport factor 2 family protein n=1 Tax=Winogradskyella pelagia TaxID=2819984 RepID=A0ABS3SYV2_9FLAO|nr:nuclear transport factor 2 family protein [Winogradskyella sp. DF17]MBO3115632.1 nuclear transport factor 2 family protein [Winogradskyella sp. DF17]
MKYFVICILSCLFISCISVKADVTTTESPSSYLDSPSLAEAAIRLVLEQQTKTWNEQDIEGFMETYWKSDNLKFYGKSGLTRGWDATLARYKMNFPTKAESGTLSFDITDISKIEANAYWVMGQFHLDRDAGNADGIFMLVFKKIDGQWKIVADMSCS